MAYALKGRQEFKLNDRATVVCHRQKTRMAFRHIADLEYDGMQVDRATIAYQNRTWESYEYQSVLEKLVDKTKMLSAEEKTDARDLIANGFRVQEQERIDSRFSTVAMVAGLGDIFYEHDLPESNKWKMRMIKAGLGEGFIPPDDWDTLSELEKSLRLDKTLEFMRRELHAEV